MRKGVNIFVLLTLLLFFYFKGCVLTLIMYKIIDTKNWINPIDRIKYVLGIDTHYNIKYKKIVIQLMIGLMDNTYLYQ